jgi:hypothetical protein
MRRSCIFGHLWLVTTLAGCASKGPGAGFGEDGGTWQVDGSTSAGQLDATTDTPRLVVPDAASVIAEMSAIAVVYGQSGTTLYAVNPDTKAVAAVGDFKGCDGAVIDIALDKTSTMYATTFGGVYTVDTTTAACSLIAHGNYPNSLSFVPAGTLDPNVEALVGYNGSDYVRIDTTTGAVSVVGSIGKGYSSSGDIVSVIGGGTYLTVTGGEACASYNCLIEVDPSTGALVTNYGPLGYTQVYGLAFWAGTVYGFDNAGQLFQVTLPGGKLDVSAIPIPNAPLGLSFYGAGSTTSAPPVSTVK